MATKCVLNKSTMTAIANAIRAKDGSTDAMLPGAMAAKITAIETSNPFYDGDRPLISKLNPAAEEIYLLADLEEFHSGMLGARNSLQINIQTYPAGTSVLEEGHLDHDGRFVVDSSATMAYWSNYVRSYTADDGRYILFRVRPTVAGSVIYRAQTATVNTGNDDTGVTTNSIVECNFNLPSLVNASPNIVMPNGYPYQSNNWPTMRRIKGLNLNAGFNMQGCRLLETVEIADAKGWTFNNACMYNGSSISKIVFHNAVISGVHSLLFDTLSSLVYLDLEGCDCSRCVQLSPNNQIRLQIFKTPGRSKMWRASCTFTGNWVNDATMRTNWLNNLPDNTTVPQYSTSSAYAVGDWVWYNSKLYGCKTAITRGEAFTASKWVEGGKWTLGTYLSSLSDAEKAIATNKGWTLA